MFSDLNPHIFFGGDNAVFWNPLSWTIIFGLIVAFFMTLLVVPAMYLIAERLKRPMRNQFGGKWVSMAGLFPVIAVILAAIVNPVVALIFFLVFPVMLGITWFRHSRDTARRRRLLQNDPNVNKSFIGSWF